MRSMTLVFQQPLEVALLDRRQGGVDDHELGGLDLQRRRRTPWPCRSRTGWPAPSGARARARRGRPRGRSPAPGPRPRQGGSRRARGRRRRARRAKGPRPGRAGGGARQFSGGATWRISPAGLPLLFGRRVVQPHGGRRHDRRHGMLVDQLDMAVTAQQQAEIVERADHALQLDAVDQKYGDRNLVLADVVQKHVLKVLLLLSRHFSCPTSFLALYRYPARAPSGYRTQVHAPAQASCPSTSILARARGASTTQPASFRCRGQRHTTISGATCHPAFNKWSR